MVIGPRFRRLAGRPFLWAAAVAVACVTVGSTRADSPTGPPVPSIAAGSRTAALEPVPVPQAESVPTAVVGDPLFVGGAGVGGCSSCGGGGCGGCGEGGCDGRPGCTTCEGQTRLGRLYCAFHNAVCCPDPCYQPRWVPAANAAFFVDHARPTTMTRLRWDSGRNLTDPDRAEFFWAQIGGPGPANPETRVDYNELHLYQEVGTDKFSVFIDLPYRSFDSQRNGGHGGIGDLQIGTKTVLLDSEVLLATFQFVTTIPTAGPGGGVGTGHVSLDPSLLTSLKLTEDTYYQGQLGYWFGVGNSNGSVLHYHNAISRVLFRPLADTAVIGTFEAVGWSFASGSVTGSDGVVRGANDTTYFSVGPGVRVAMCDRLDFGFGAQFAVTRGHFADQLYRTELRWRF